MTVGEIGTLPWTTAVGGGPPCSCNALCFLQRTSNEGLKVRPLWVLCPVLVPRPSVPQCHYLTAKWDGVWEENLTDISQGAL